MKKPRLTERDRLEIELGLKAGKTPYAIAKELGRPAKTVVREIRARLTESEKGAFGRVTNRCAHRMQCQARKLCAHCLYDGNRRCCLCRLYNRVCKQFVEQPCGNSEVCPRWNSEVCPRWIRHPRGGALAKPSDSSEFKNSEVCPRWICHPQRRSVSEAIGHIGVQ